MKLRPSVRRTLATAGALAVVVALAVAVVVALNSSHGRPAGATGAVLPRGDANGPGRAALPVDDVEEVSRLIDAVQKHLANLRLRIQDRPSAPQVRPIADGGSTNGQVALADFPGSPQHDDMDETIFLSVAAFRDIECAPTIENLYAQAKFPHRIFAGIVDQRESTDGYCIPSSFFACQRAVWDNAASHPNETRTTFCPIDNLRFRRTTPLEARGPTFGRFVAQLMYQGEKYFMMIDSHNRFVHHWDSRLVRMYLQLPTKGVISHYPSGYEPGFVMESNRDIMFMCYAHFYDGVGILRNGAKNVRNRQKRPVLQPFTAAGFLFGLADFVFDVPFDPYLDYLFDGEEILYTVRLWTHGWDSYLPSHDIMYHFYGRPKAPKVWGTNNQWVAIQQVSQRRVLYLLRMTKPNTTVPLVDPATEPDSNQRIFKELDKYGLGTERRLEDFWPFAHVDPIKRQSDRGFCDRAT